MIKSSNYHSFLASYGKLDCSGAMGVYLETQVRN